MRSWSVTRRNSPSPQQNKPSRTYQDSFRRSSRGCEKSPHRCRGIQELAQIQRPAPPPVRTQAPVTRAPQPPRPANGSTDLSAAQIKVLSRLVELLECTGETRVRKEQLAAWAEYSPNSGGFNNYLGSLRSAGLIDYPQPGMVGITDAGRAVAQPESVPADSKEMLARAKRVLGGSEGKLLELLHESREVTPKTALAEAAGFSPNSGGFNNYLGHMRTLGFCGVSPARPG